MHRFDKQSAMAFVHGNAAWFDQAAGANPFASSAWITHFLDSVVPTDWTIWVPEHEGPDRGLMLLYSDDRGGRHLHALSNYYASLYTPLISAATDINVRARNSEEPERCGYPLH